MKKSRIVIFMLVAVLFLSGLPSVSQAASSGKEFVAVINLNLRSSASDVASPVVYLEEGARVSYFGKSVNDWFQVEYGNKTGYVHRGSLTSVDNYESTEPAKIHNIKLKDTNSKKSYKVVIDINLRTGNSDNYRSVNLLKMGSEVKYLGETENGWFKVEDLSGSLGYIYRGDVTSPENYDSKEPAKIHDLKLKDTNSSKKFKTIIDQNLRSGDAKQYRAIGLVPRGEELVHLGTTGNQWFKVRTEAGQVGYVYRGDVTSAGKDESAELARAVEEAKNILEGGSMSKSLLIEYVVYEGFDSKIASAAVESLDIDWKEMPVKSIYEYLYYYERISEPTIIRLLRGDGFNPEEIDYALEKTNLDFFEFAFQEAGFWTEEYLSSKAVVMDLMQAEGYSSSHIDYALERLNADWKSIALKNGQQFLDSGYYSKEDLIENLEFEVFTQEEIDYVLGVIY